MKHLRFSSPSRALLLWKLSLESILWYKYCCSKANHHGIQTPSCFCEVNRYCPSWASLLLVLPGGGESMACMSLVSHCLFSPMLQSRVKNFPLKSDIDSQTTKQRQQNSWHGSLGMGNSVIFIIFSLSRRIQLNSTPLRGMAIKYV